MKNLVQDFLLRLVLVSLIGMGLGAFLASNAQACTAGGCVTAGPRLASVDSQRGVLLNALLGNLTGSTLNLTVADWNSLASGNVSLVKVLSALQANLNVSTPTTALNTNATVAQVLAAAATAATGEGKTTLAAALDGARVSLTPLAGTIKLGDLLKTDGAVGTTQINMLELLTGVVQLYNTKNVLTTPSALQLTGAQLNQVGTLASVSLAAQVIEPPVYVCGPVGSTFHTASIRVKLGVNLVTLNPNVALLTALGVTASVQIAHLDLYVEVARAEGVISAIDAINAALTVQVTPGLADLYLGTMSDAVFFNRSHVINATTDLGWSTIGDVTINGLTVALRVKSSARGQAPSATALTLGGANPTTGTAYTQAAFASNLVGSLVGNLSLSITPSLGWVLDGLVLPVLKTVVQLALAPALGNILTVVADPLLELLGIRLGEVDVRSGGTYRICSIAGFVYDDGNHNSRPDTGESGMGTTLYAKLLASDQPAGPALAVATVDATTGAFTFPTVNSASYFIVINTVNTASQVTPAAPTGWVATEVPTLSRSVTLAAANLTGQRFGLYHGSRLSGTVFKDTGTGSGGLANNGVRDGSEAGIPGSAVKLTDAAGTLVYDQATTTGDGSFTFWLPHTAAGTVKLTQATGADWVSVAGHAGNTAGTYARAQDTLSFTHLSGTAYTGITFADVPANRFDTEGQQSLLPGSVVFFPHTYTAGTAGQLTFTASAPTSAGWSATVYRDANCDGRLEASDTVVATALAVVAEQKVCVVAKVFAPATAPYNSQYPLALSAHLAYAHSAITSTLQRNDLATVGQGTDTGLRLAKGVDKAAATLGDSITYTITFTNQSHGVLTAVKVMDATPAYTVFTSATCGALPTPAMACTVTTQPAANGTGRVEWTLTGEMTSGASGSVSFTVKLQ